MSNKPRQRTAREHAEALYEALDHLGFLHSHVKLEEFLEQFMLSLIEADKKVDEIDPLAMFAEFNMTKAREESNGTYSREQDRNSAVPRRKRHEELMEKWPPLWWEYQPVAHAWEQKWLDKKT